MSKRSRAFPWFKDGKERPPKPSYPAPKDEWSMVDIEFKPIQISMELQRYNEFLRQVYTVMRRGLF